MKRRDLIRILEQNGCILKREGAKHSLYLNPLTKKIETIPRHNEVNEFLAKKIIKNLTK